MNTETLRHKAIALCAKHGVSVRAYGPAFWLTGAGVNRVVADLAGLCRSDLAPLSVVAR
ncbi:hypothetical protein PTW32_16030 [Dechloromonas agitata]|uniref:hypothetical protein n=1 Tax=Dechloromonas agitata TaxID=73030 RepID=UPI00237DB58F|nr:hypothetical protein [Dechloromonas agitata]MDE1546926.1 hypothetical protein [Dechloromonas agitata]